MPNTLAVSRLTAKKYLDYYFAGFMGLTNSKEELPMPKLVEAIYRLLENPDKKINEFSVMISQDKELDCISQFHWWNSNYGGMSREQFVQKLVDSIRIAESKKWSNFDLFVLQEKLEREIKEIKENMRNPYQKIL